MLFTETEKEKTMITSRTWINNHALTLSVEQYDSVTTLVLKFLFPF